MKEQNIGNVHYTVFGNQKDQEYADGAEGDLLRIFQSDDATGAVGEVMQNPTWAQRYHLSPVRENLLSWYPFEKDSRVLEIGAGCGAVTGALCDMAREVVAVELNPARAEVIAWRHKGRSNLRVIAGNSQDVEIDGKFDYLTLVGVLEYAGKYTDGDDPFADFLTKMKSHLKPGGTMIIAIENRHGLKYWSGASEDHTAKFFESIEGYPHYNGVQTFTKPQLKRLLARVGFSTTQFYYPWPDYKMPTEIFSDDYLPSLDHGIRRGMFPSPDYVIERQHFFNEKRAMDDIADSGYPDLFSNSFLVFAQ